MSKMIIASVDLRIVVDDREELTNTLNQIQALDSTHIIGWTEYYYDGKRKPKSKKVLEAIEVTKAKKEERQSA